MYLNDLGYPTHFKRMRIKDLFNFLNLAEPFRFGRQIQLSCRVLRGTGRFGQKVSTCVLFQRQFCRTGENYCIHFSPPPTASIYFLSEQFDFKNRKTFLKRTQVPNIRLDDIYIGATVVLFSRQLQVVDFGDQYTKVRMDGQREE